MRAIGQLPSETQAQTFSDHLVAHKIRNEIDGDGGAWIVWIKDEEQVADAKARLERFFASPEAPEFQSARTQAARVKAAEAEDLANYRQRLRNRRSMFPKLGGYGVGVLTYGLIALCVVVAILSTWAPTRSLSASWYWRTRRERTERFCRKSGRANTGAC